MPNPNPHHDYDTRRHHHPPPPKPSPKLLSIFLKFIIMSLILSFFLLFLGLAAIVLLHLLLAGSFLHRRRQRTTPYSIRDLLNHLPPFRYSLESPSPASDECSICLEFFREGELCRAIPVCDHVFHAHCVDLWLNKVPNCPICRTRIRLDAGGLSDLTNGNDECKFLWAIGVGR